MLPAPRQLTLAAGESLYCYDGKDFPPHRNTGSAPECRIEISPPQPREIDFFLHVLTATDAGTETVPRAAGRVEAGRVQVTWAGLTLAFPTDSVGGEITWRGQANTLAEAIRTGQKPLVR